MHSLATLVERPAINRTTKALATAVGWYLTKHGSALLSATPPTTPFAALDPQAEVDAAPRRVLSTEPATAPIETYTALFHHDGSPSLGVIAVLLPDGQRALAMSQEAATLEALTATDPLGATATLDGAAGFTLD